MSGDATNPAELPAAGPVGLGDRLRAALSSEQNAEPLYPRLLRLRNIHPSAWQRALLVEGMVIVGILVSLADLATSWSPVVLPVAAAAVVKFHDVLAGVLPRRAPRVVVAGATGPADDDGATGDRVAPSDGAGTG